MSEWNAHRFYYEPGAERDGRVRLSEEEARHALQVLRLKQGARIIVTDGARHVYEAEIEEADRASWRLTARLGQALPDAEARTRVTLFQGIPKSGKMELIVQKCTELGADAIAPLRLARCVPETERNPEKNLQRLCRVAREAAKQCGRGAVPRVGASQTLREAEAALRGCDCLLVPWEEAGARGARVADVIPSGMEGSVGVVIGPEGGITREEIALLTEWGGRTVTLGPRILRTETAGMAALVAILSASGDI